MVDFETLMFIISFGPLALVIILVEVILRILFRGSKNEDNRKAGAD